MSAWQHGDSTIRPTDSPRPSGKAAPRTPYTQSKSSDSPQDGHRASEGLTPAWTNSTLSDTFVFISSASGAQDWSSSRAANWLCGEGTNNGSAGMKITQSSATLAVYERA